MPPHLPTSVPPQFRKQQTTSGPLSRPGAPSPRVARSPQEGPQEVATQTPRRPQPSNPQAREPLISRSLSTHERVSLIKSIFSDCDKAKEVEGLSGDDAQTFIDVISEVSAYTFIYLR